ncbi:MAG: sulfite exporter TauE/SafE family protein [Armatimonadetes bacterium]|nr:sulfite exporter TauE/SafE family protein [Armatimonadota bacterium]
MEHLLVGFVAGLAATPHCVGMCGGFALHLARGDRPRVSVGRLFLFLVGKAFTYVFLGALVGALGLWIVQSGWLPGARKALVLLAAVITIALGILMLELPIRMRLPTIRWPGAGLFGEQGPRLLRGGSLLGPFLFGLAAGYLPCPLTMLLLVAAGGEQSVGAGMLLLGGAGFGTMPGLLLTGGGGALVRGRWRAVGTRLLGGLVILFGVLMLLRRLGVIPGAHGGACH